MGLVTKGAVRRAAPRTASQLPHTKWHEYLGDPTVADAILDRVLHNAHRLVLKGPSRRKEKDQVTSRRLINQPASLRSDHDALDGAITMPWSG